MIVRNKSFVISRLLVQDILVVNSPYTRIRSRGMFVIALRGYLREFGPKTIHFWLLSQCTLPLLQSNPILPTICGYNHAAC